jgi:eukaryotic-like serine/threonine-protein kinase
MNDARTSQVADRYTLLDLLGSGGAGAVWRARDELLHRLVAVKEVRLLTGDPESVRDRVLREARATARLNHPSVTAVYDVIPGEGTVHIVMELVEGGTLTERVRGGGPLEPEEAARVGQALLGALEAAHERGIVHRDVKPSNVLLPGGGAPPKLTDFGIASVADDMTLTATGTVLGSPSFIAPEQATGSSSGPAADLWGLGALLYFAVEGVAPFDRGEPLPTLTAVVHEPARPMERAGALAPLIERLLRKEPGERPDVADVRRELGAILAQPDERAAVAPAGQEPTQVLPAVAPVETTAAVAADPVSTRTGEGEGEAAAANPRPWASPLVLVTIFGVVVLLALAAWAAGRDDRPEVVAPAPEAAGTPDAPTEPIETPEPEEATPPTEEPAEPEPTATPDEPDALALPEGWEQVAVGPVGATVQHPVGWERQEVSATITDFRDPSSSTYLRTDWTDAPAADPVADWERQSASFGQRQSEYTELRIEPMRLDGHDAAIWEYTYTAGGAELRAVNIGLVAGEHGYALNFQTRADEWDAWGATLQSILESFDAPG